MAIYKQIERSGRPERILPITTPLLCRSKLAEKRVRNTRKQERVRNTSDQERVRSFRFFERVHNGNSGPFTAIECGNLENKPPEDVQLENVENFYMFQKLPRITQNCVPEDNRDIIINQQANQSSDLMKMDWEYFQNLDEWVLDTPPLAEDVVIVDQMLSPVPTELLLNNQTISNSSNEITSSEQQPDELLFVVDPPSQQFDFNMLDDTVKGVNFNLDLFQHVGPPSPTKQLELLHIPNVPQANEEVLATPDVINTVLNFDKKKDDFDLLAYINDEIEELPSQTPSNTKSNRKTRTPTKSPGPSITKRGRPPKKHLRTTSISSEDTTSSSKYRELRDKNNEASRRSRINRKLREANLEQECADLEAKHVSLTARVSQLEQLVNRLRKELLLNVMKK